MEEEKKNNNMNGKMKKKSTKHEIGWMPARYVCGQREQLGNKEESTRGATIQGLETG